MIMMTQALKTDADPLVEFVGRLPRMPHAGGELWRNALGEVVGRFLGLDLGSAFQPLREANSYRIVGHEAFVRSVGGLSPWTLFAHAASDDQLIELDRTCRTVHAIRYFARRRTQGRLFLNVHGRLMHAVADNHGRTFRRVLDALAIPAGRIVIESPEALSDCPALLGCVMGNYRRAGFRTAMNLVAVSQAQELVNRISPDFVKIDIGRLRSAEDLAELSSQARRRGVSVIVKRVETSEQLALARIGGADLLQGHVFERASPAHLEASSDPVSRGEDPIRNTALSRQ